MKIYELLKEEEIRQKLLKKSKKSCGYRQQTRQHSAAGTGR
jgi:hypothetical protein